MAIFLLLLMLHLIPPAAVRHPPSNALPFGVFAAEMVTASPVLSPVRVEIYRAQGRLRVNLPQGGYQLYTLKRHRARWVHRDGLCSPAPFRPPPGVLPFFWRGRVTRKRLGAARLYGHRVEIEQITVHLPIARRGPQRGFAARPARKGARQVFTAWLAKDLGGFPLRIQFVSAHGPLEINYRHIRLGPPPRGLLRLPAQCPGVPRTPALRR